MHGTRLRRGTSSLSLQQLWWLQESGADSRGVGYHRSQIQLSYTIWDCQPIKGSVGIGKAYTLQRTPMVYRWISHGRERRCRSVWTSPQGKIILRPGKWGHCLPIRSICDQAMRIMITRYPQMKILLPGKKKEWTENITNKNNLLFIRIRVYSFLWI